MQLLKFILKLIRMKNIISLTVVALLVLTNGCKKRNLDPNDLNGPYIPPHTLYFTVKENNQLLPDSILRNVSLEYFNEAGTRYYVGDFNYVDTLGMRLFTTRQVGNLSSRGNFKTYYLSYPSGQFDTLFIDYEYLPRPQADTTTCYCFYPLRHVSFNGTPAPLDAALTSKIGYDVYLFEKK